MDLKDNTNTNSIWNIVKLFNNKTLEELYEIKDKEWESLKPVERLVLIFKIKQLEKENN